MGWFHATPKLPAAKQNKIDPEKPLSRAEKIQANGGTPLMPDLGAAHYLANYWFELGLVGHGAMGPVVFSASELLAWQQASGIDLTPWEFRVLRDMSRSYIASMSAAEKPECPPPYGKQVEEFDRSVISNKVSNAFKSFLQVKR